MPTSKTLLVVDDSLVSRMMIKGRVLAARPDWVIHEAANAAEAIALTMSKAPDFISMDVNMPGVSGFEAVAQLRACGSTASIVILTANVQSSSRDKARELHVHFVQKPATESAVQQMLGYFEAAP